MPASCSVIPAYGRDYKTGKEAKEAFFANKDFILCDTTSRWDRKPCNKQDLTSAGYKFVEIRFNKLMGITTVELQ